jgi:hypothetical protein
VSVVPEPIVVRWTPQLSDLADAYEARRVPMGYRRRAFVMSGVLVGLCLLGISTRSEALLSPALTIGVLGLAVLPPGTARFLTRRSVKSIWKANPSLALPVEASLNADGLRFQNASSETRHDWSAFSGWIESENVLVLCLSNFKGAFITMPTRALTGAEVHQRLRALLTENLGPAMVTRAQVRSQQPVS